MKIITYNVNGLRAAVSKGLPEWLAQENPDILCLQETKLQPDQYPGEVFEALGYKSYLYSAQKKGYSGVAILTKQEPDHVEYGMGMEAYDNEGRFIRADFGDLSVVSVYHPSGTSGDERQAFKMVWLEDFQKYVMELQKSRPNLILCGDYNICHEPIDIHDPVRNATNSGFLPEEREWMTRFLSAGYVDSFRTLCPEKQEYTWWSYRFNSRAKNKGWRIDYCMVSEPVRPLLKRAYILNEAVHSDHCPMALEILKDSNTQFTGVSSVAKFAEVDTLPCSQVQAVILDGDSDRASYQGCFYMGAHIVGAFEGMDEIGGTVGNQFIKECLKVMPYVRVCIFVDG